MNYKDNQVLSIFVYFSKKEKNDVDNLYRIFLKRRFNQLLKLGITPSCKSSIHQEILKIVHYLKIFLFLFLTKSDNASILQRNFTENSLLKCNFIMIVGKPMKEKRFFFLLLVLIYLLLLFKVSRKN